MTRAELGKAQRQIAIRPDLLPKQLHVTRAIHRFQRESAFVVRELKHVGAEFSPVTTALPQGARQQLRRTDLPEAATLHFAANVVFNQPVKSCPAWVPERSPRCFLLLMKK